MSAPFRRLGPVRSRALVILAAAFSGLALFGQSVTAPRVVGIVRQGADLVISAAVPAGFHHTLLTTGANVREASSQPLVAGALDGRSAIVTFRIPPPVSTLFLRVEVGTNQALPSAPHAGAPYVTVDTSGGAVPLSEDEKLGHVLSRLAYGPTPEDLQAVRAEGVSAYIQQQLNPASIDESSNEELNAREAELFTWYRPADDTPWIRAGDAWRYFKGSQAPPATWKETTFDASAWPSGPSGFGYGDGDDETELEDMEKSEVNPGYLTVFLRREFQVTEPMDFEALILRVDFDDGFVAYLNGVEVARANVTGNPPRFDSAATENHEAGSAEEYDLTARRSLLHPGMNLLAIQVHNNSLDSTDASMIPELVRRKFQPVPPVRRIRGIQALQQLAHVRGIYSHRQLQIVLGEFWENHFTTDYDKVAAHFEDLRNSDAQRAMSERQAALEAAQAEYTEYQFFLDHALGNFGDLLLYSATSPTQLIYLDNILNGKEAPNENYAREILELFAFGVDNRYTQTDIEQLARCFTGWTIRKVLPQDQKPFPASARTPPTLGSVQFSDTVLMDLGPGWKYFKGTREPAPGAGGTPTLAWTGSGFDESGWLTGSTGIGYGDGDDATIVGDMRNKYLTIYLRREVQIDDPEVIQNLLLSVDYDDGYVAYLNGTEIARSGTMRGTGTPPAFNRIANGGHEAGEEPDIVNLADFAHLWKLAPEKNVLAIQAHNLSRDSTDLSILPRLVNRQLLPGSVENGDPNGVWTFRFNPDDHDTGDKVLFAGLPEEIRIPGGREGAEGVRDALDVIDRFVDHPSVAEFICLKLINKLVSDEISLSSYRDGTAPEELQRLMGEAIRAWRSTTPAGNIRTVVSAILTPESQSGQFWSRSAYRAKVKTPIEFINSTVRALRPDVGGTSLSTVNDSLGMHLFDRDDPDGWSEVGVDWIDTGTLLARMQFAQDLAGNRVPNLRWNVETWASAHQLTSAEAIVDYLDQLLFQGRMDPANKNLLVQFATTDDAGNPLPFAPGRTDFARRARELVGMIFSMPQWHYQ